MFLAKYVVFWSVYELVLVVDEVTDVGDEEGMCGGLSSLSFLGLGRSGTGSQTADTPLEPLHLWSWIVSLSHSRVFRPRSVCDWSWSGGC